MTTIILNGVTFQETDRYSARHVRKPSFWEWLLEGRENTLAFRKLVREEGKLRDWLFLPLFELQNYLRGIAPIFYIKSAPALPVRGYTRIEKTGLVLTASLLISSPFIADSSAAVVEESEIISAIAPEPQEPVYPVLSSRPEVGVYADPNYRHPHLRIAMGPSTPVLVRFDTLAGEPANSGWFSRYIGVPLGKVPTEATVDPLAQHARMFDVKFDPDASWEVQPVARTMDEQYAEMYNTQRTHMTLPQFVAGVQTVIDETRNDIDWESLCADRRIDLNREGCTLLRQVSGQISAEMLVTYGMTELFPREQSRTHDFNRRVLENGLINYGREFWDLTPAQSDGLASAGLWQLTSKAVGAYVDEDGEPRIGGATIVGRYVDNRPPESFLDFARTDHEQAAYLFAVHNIALLINKASANPRSLATMRRVWVEGDRQPELLQYIATAHHAPYGVHRSALRWLGAGAVRPYQHYLRGRFVEYARRTRLNWPSMAPEGDRQ